MPKTAKSSTTKKGKASASHAKDLDAAWQHASSLARRLMLLMSDRVEDVDASDAHWERVFGTKESAVVNLQKLVGVLASISQHIASAAEHDSHAVEGGTLSQEDYRMLMRWIEREMDQGD